MDDSPVDPPYPIFSKRSSKGRFESEAEGLRLLRVASRGHLNVPRVAFSKDDVGIDLERIDGLRSGSRADAVASLARGMRAIHEWQAPTAPSPMTFGFALPGQCGDLEHPNNEDGRVLNWVQFFREYRLEHQLRVLRERNPHERRIIELVVKLCRNLDSFFEGKGVRCDAMLRVSLHNIQRRLEPVEANPD